MPTVLVLDLGSSSTRVMAFDARAEMLPNSMLREACQFSVGADGRVEDDALAVWRRVERLMRASPFAATADAISISSYAGSLVCLDASGKPISPVYTYADTRASDDAARLRAEHDELVALDRTGCRIRANYSPAKLVWLKRVAPDTFARTRWFASVSDFVRMRLSRAREPRTSLSVASWTGLLNHRTLDWDAEWLAALGIAREQLPAFEARDDAPIVAFGDGAAANIGSGCDSAARIAVTIGTTAALRIATPHAPPQLAPAVWCYRVDDARALIGGATSEGGNVVSWLAGALDVPLDKLEAMLRDASPDAHGLTVLPLFAGERSPGFADAATATLHGLRLDTTASDIARAMVESVAYRLALIGDALRPLAGPNAELVGSGGALVASPAWQAIVADATGLTLRMCDEPEATARGAAVLGLQHLGVVKDASALPPKLSAPIAPDAARHAVYRAAMQRQAALYEKLVASRGQPLNPQTH